MPQVDPTRQRRGVRSGASESAIVASIVKALKARGCWVLKTHGGPLQRAGVPDLAVVYRGWSIWLEVKRPGETATPLQLHTIAQIQAAGAEAAVVTSAGEAIAVLDRLIASAATNQRILERVLESEAIHGG